MSKSGVLSVKGTLASGKISSKKYIVTITPEGTLSLAKEKNKDETEGILHISSTFIVSAPKKKEFSLESPDKSRELRFSCSTDDEAEQWYNSIAQLISALGRTYVGADLSVATSGQVEIPALMVNCLKRIRPDMKTQGIFRLSGAKPDIDRIKKAFNNGERPAMQNEDCHAVTGILKQYLRELPDPLCTFALYNDFLKAAQSPSPAEALTQVVSSLPAINQATLKVLSEFLWEVAQFEPENMMGFQNLAIVFGPTILRSKDENLETISNSGIVCRVAQLLIERSASIFAKIPLPKSAIGLLGSSSDAAPPPPTTNPGGPPPPMSNPGPPPPTGMPGPPPPTGMPGPPPPTSMPGPPPPLGLPTPPPPPAGLPPSDGADSGESHQPPPPRPAFQLPAVLPKLRPVPPKQPAPPPFAAPPPAVPAESEVLEPTNAPAPVAPMTTTAPAPMSMPPAPLAAGVKIALPLPGKRPAPAPVSAPPPPATAEEGKEEGLGSLPVFQGAPQRPLQSSGSSPSVPPPRPASPSQRNWATMRKSMPPTASLTLDSGEDDEPTKPAPPPVASRPAPGVPSSLVRSMPGSRTGSSNSVNSDTPSEPRATAPEARLTALEERMSRLEALQAEQKSMLEMILQKLQNQKE